MEFKGKFQRCHPKEKVVLEKAGKGEPPLGVTVLTRSLKRGGNSVKVRHILYDKHRKIMEVMEKLKSGVRFNEVDTQYSEDKGRQGDNLGG